MKVLSNLSATVRETPTVAQHGIRQTVTQEIGPGQWRTITISDDGVQIRLGDAAVFLPTNELITLAEHSEPLLKAVPQTSKSAVASPTQSGNSRVVPSPASKPAKVAPTR